MGFRLALGFSSREHSFLPHQTPATPVPFRIIDPVSEDGSIVVVLGITYGLGQFRTK